MTRTLLVVLCCTVTLGVTTLEAQNPQTREGFWIGLGLGAGSVGADCDLCNDDREIGLSGNLRLGGALSQKVLLGAGTNGWIKSESGINQSVGALSALVVFYPSATGGFFLQGGLGVLRYEADDGVDEVTSTGFGALLGLGYDFRVGGNFSLSPFLNFLASSGGSLKFDGMDLDIDFNANLVQFGLGVTWH
ncbi:MAG: hypothetical protein ACYTEI_12490 [Planctomycetota bacterium]|jgi:hypothetical protein